MRLGRVSIAAISLVLGAPGAVFAQSSSDDWFAPPPPPPGTRQGQQHYPQHCSLDQREYAYINECGELIPGIWDPIPGRGDQ